MGAVPALGAYAEQTRTGASVGQAVAGSGPALTHATFTTAWDLHGEPFWLTPRDFLMLPQECGKGRAPQVTFTAQVRVKVRDTVRVRVQVRVRVLSAGA